MKYSYSEHWTLKTREIARQLGFHHIDFDRVAVIESKGSKAKRTIARIHSLGKVMQEGMQANSFYTIELITEQFHKQPENEKIKTLIHELLHIPNSFGGGFRHHKDHVTHKNVEKAFEKIKHNFLDKSFV